MLQIHLKDLRFICCHGVHAEELLVPATFIVDADLTMNEPDATIIALDRTLNYAEVHQLIRDRMLRPTPLLETIAMELTAAILSLSDQVRQVSIRITKTTPPIAQFSGQVAVTHTASR